MDYFAQDTRRYAQTERTLIVIKPDAVRRGLVGKIIQRFEDRSLKLVALELRTLEKERLEDLYSPHRGKPFFNDLVEFMSSGPVAAAILEGPEVIKITRLMMGNTKSPEAAPGTIRGDFGLGVTENIIHASDTLESFERESKILFP